MIKQRSAIIATPVIIPQYGTSADKVILQTWLKQEGDKVERGDLICTLETDKASTELEAFAEGILLRQLVDAGSEAEIGQVIAYIGEFGETLPEDQADTTEKSATTAEPVVDAGDSPSQAQQVQLSGIKASPATRKLARELGIDLVRITGTGAGGKIIREDVLRAAGGR